MAKPCRSQTLTQAQAKINHPSLATISIPDSSERGQMGDIGEHFEGVVAVILLGNKKEKRRRNSPHCTKLPLNEVSVMQLFGGVEWTLSKPLTQ